MKLTEDNPSIENFVPLLLVIYKCISSKDPNNEIIKQIITIYIKYRGNINLQSSLGKKSILSGAIETVNIDLMLFLIKNGADKKLLSKKQQSELDEILPPVTPPETPSKTPPKTPSKTPPKTPPETPPKTPPETPPKTPPAIILATFPPTPPSIIRALNIREEEPVEYAMDVEPAFWRPLFQPNEMTELRQQIQSLMNNDYANPPTKNDKYNQYQWSICDINKSLIPTYYVSSIIESRNLITIQSEFKKYNILLCASLIVVGIISNKMKDYDYKIIIKGGKAVQLVLHNIDNADAYPSEDIDLLIVPKSNTPYNRDIIKNLAAHIAFLMKWFLTDSIFKVSVGSPNPENLQANQNIYKLSYIKDAQIPKYNRQTGKLEMNVEYRAFSDIDFKETDDFFQETVEYPFYVSELKTKILFTCPTVDSILAEKKAIRRKYTDYLEDIEKHNGIPILEQGKPVSAQDCRRYIAKFSRAIDAIETAMRKNNL